VLSALVFADAAGRVVNRRGKHVLSSASSQTDRSDSCGSGVTGFSGHGEGQCSDPSSANHDCVGGALVSSTSCPGDQKCCMYVPCTWSVPDDDPLHSDWQTLAGACQATGVCNALPNRRAITPSLSCGGAQMVCCITIPKEGSTVGSQMDEDAQRVKELQSTPCNSNSGTCDPTCTTGTPSDDTSGVCKGGQCCDTSSHDPDTSSAAPTPGHSDESSPNTDSDNSGGDGADTHGASTDSTSDSHDTPTDTTSSD